MERVQTGQSSFPSNDDPGRPVPTCSLSKWVLGVYGPNGHLFEAGKYF